LRGLPASTLSLRFAAVVAVVTCFFAGCARQSAEPPARAPQAGAQAYEPSPAPIGVAADAVVEASPEGGGHEGHDHGEGDACGGHPGGPSVLSPTFAPPPAVAKLEHGDPEHKRVALTFDGAPGDGSTTAILAILRAYKVKGTFFIVGDRAKANRRYVDAMLAEKHLVGTQGMRGDDLTALSKADMAASIGNSARLVADAIEGLHAVPGPQMRVLRPPQGRCSQALLDVTRALGYTVVVLWSVDGVSARGKWPEEPVQRICAEVKGGSIIRLSDSVETTRMLARLLDRLLESGYECVTVDEMAGSRDDAVWLRDAAAVETARSSAARRPSAATVPPPATPPVSTGSR